MANWPATLPDPLMSGYGLETTDPTARTDMESGPARVRRRFTAAPDKLSLRFLFDTSQMAIFRAFWESDFQNGAVWANLRIKDGRTATPVLKECRPVNGVFKCAPLSATHWSVEFQVEVRNA